MQQDIALDLICQGDRYRDVNEGKAHEIAVSMEQQGLLQPIGVKPCQCERIEEEHYRLIFGAHRIAAAHELQWETIAATIFPHDLIDESARLAELQENSARHDLNRQQRIQYAGEIGRISEKMQDDRNSENFRKIWFDELSKKLSVDIRTLYNWWYAFCGDQGIDVRPSKAHEGFREAFYDWCDEQHRKAEAEKQRKADEARERRIATVCTAAVKYLSAIVQEYGFEVVQHQIWEVVYTQYEASLAEAPLLEE